MIRRTPLKRSTKPIARSPIKRRRSKPRRGEPTQLEKEQLRQQVYRRAGGRCELRNKAECVQGVLPYSGITPWDHGHLVHMKSIGAGGKWTEENCKWGCHVCHLIGLHVEGGKGKIIPKKQLP